MSTLTGCKSIIMGVITAQDGLAAKKLFSGKSGRKLTAPYQSLIYPVKQHFPIAGT